MNAKLIVALIWVMLAPRAIFAASGSYIVAPNDLQNVDGNSGTHWPWASGPMRCQQVYDASQFQLLADSSGGWIKSLSFRLDGGDIGDFFRSVSNVHINLSTTTREPDALSPIFAENIGPDERVVLSDSIVTFTLNREQGVSVQPFFNLILIDPFFYNPNQGNLLMDIRIFSESPIFLPSDLDSSRVLGDSVSRVVGAINSQSGFTVDTDGLVTRFFVEAIPEPSVLSLIITGVASGLFLRCWRRRR